MSVVRSRMAKAALSGSMGIVLLFGTKKLRGIGSDLGSAIKGFRSSVKDDADKDNDEPPAQLSEQAKTDAGKAAAAQQTAPKDKV